jgi:malate/lactate dehydrogenase
VTKLPKSTPCIVVLNRNFPRKKKKRKRSIKKNGKIGMDIDKKVIEKVGGVISITKLNPVNEKNPKKSVRKNL